MVQLSLRDYDPTSPADVDELKNSLLVVVTNLVDARSGAEVTTIPMASNPARLARQLTGSLAASPVPAPDPSLPAPTLAHGTLKAYFLFADLSCRMVGRYRLHFSIMKMSLPVMHVRGVQHVIAQTQSEVFEVFSAKDFPGMRASTPLTRHLKHHGASVGVKKGNENRAGRRPGRSDSGDDPSHSGEDPGGDLAATVGARVETGMQG